MRTQDEIAARVRERMDADFLGFEWHEYLNYLDLEHAREFLKPGAEITAEEWEYEPVDAEKLRARILDYLPFAWDKANGFRGISASRSLSHFTAWFWLMGEDAMAEAMGRHYEFYGKAQLVQVTQWLGLDPAQFDDGVRRNQE